MQLSIPSPEVAKLMSLFAAFVEVIVRNYFFNAYIKDGLKMEMKKEGEVSAKERRAYYKRGQLRVQDSNNDMVSWVVKYITHLAG